MPLQEFCHLGAGGSTRRCLPGPGTISGATLCSAQQLGLNGVMQVASLCQSGLSIPHRVYLSGPEFFYLSSFVTPPLFTATFKAEVPDNRSPPKPSELNAFPTGLALHRAGLIVMQPVCVSM